MLSSSRDTCFRAKSLAPTPAVRSFRCRSKRELDAEDIRMTKHILVAYDGSAPAERAFDFALTLARALEADVYVLAVERPPEPPEEVETEAVLESATEHFERQFATLRQRVSGTGLSARFEV